MEELGRAPEQPGCLPGSWDIVLEVANWSLCGPSTESRSSLSLGVLGHHSAFGRVVRKALQLFSALQAYFLDQAGAGRYPVSLACRVKGGWISVLDLGRLQSPKSCSKH